MNDDLVADYLVEDVLMDGICEPADPGPTKERRSRFRAVLAEAVDWHKLLEAEDE